MGADYTAKKEESPRLYRIYRIINSITFGGLHQLVMISPKILELQEDIDSFRNRLRAAEATNQERSKTITRLEDDLEKKVSVLEEAESNYRAKVAELVKLQIDFNSQGEELTRIREAKATLSARIDSYERLHEGFKEFERHLIKMGVPFEGPAERHALFLIRQQRIKVKEAAGEMKVLRNGSVRMNLAKKSK